MLPALELHPPNKRPLLLCTFGNNSRQLYSQTVLSATIPSLFLQVKIVPTFSPLLDHSSYDVKPKHLLFDCFFINHGKKKYQKLKKKSHTLSSKQRTKILPWAIHHFLMTITMMNRTIRLNKNRHLFLLGSSAYLARLQKPFFRALSLSYCQEGKISKLRQLFLWMSQGSWYNFHFNDELEGN